MERQLTIITVALILLAVLVVGLIDMGVGRLLR